MFWTILKKWLIGDMGTPGKYMYQPIHLYSLAAVIAVFVLVCAFGFFARKDSAKIRRLL